MAKYEHSFCGDFDEVVNRIYDGIMGSSSSASYEDGSDYSGDGFRCAVRVFERYSMTGGNRVSLNVTLVGRREDLFLSAITSGGSQAVLFKLNTFGEDAFLERLIEIVEQY